METPKVGQRWYKRNDRSDYIDIKSISGSMATGFDKVGKDYGRGRPMPISKLQKEYTPYK
ncbi:hypothetical protein ACFL3C_02510 [Patescibacteria group bacterium]